MTENPFSSPIAESPKTADSAGANPDSLTSIAKRVFLAWEKLRIAYIAILGVLTCLLAGTDLFQTRLLVLIVECGLVANICFFAGPIVETYICWLGFGKAWVRWPLFIGGTLLTILGVFATVGPYAIPIQN